MAAVADYSSPLGIRSVRARGRLSWGPTGARDEDARTRLDRTLRPSFKTLGCTKRITLQTFADTQPLCGREQRMSHAIHDIGAASQIGAYSDAIETAPNLRWLLTSGTPGLAATGELPQDTAGQAVIAWEYILKLLARANMQTSDIVKVTQYLTRSQDIAAYGKVRSRFLGDIRPASMLLVVPQLVWPEILVEIEVIAATARPPA
jgi:2-iminobutanoate/2-iminopropanoate deaminase